MNWRPHGYGYPNQTYNLFIPYQELAKLGAFILERMHELRTPGEINAEFSHFQEKWDGVYQPLLANNGGEDKHVKMLNALWLDIDDVRRALLCNRVREDSDFTIYSHGPQGTAKVSGRSTGPTLDPDVVKELKHR